MERTNNAADLHRRNFSEDLLIDDEARIIERMESQVVQWPDWAAVIETQSGRARLDRRPTEGWKLNDQSIAKTTV
jgi:hypothetical protein